MTKAFTSLKNHSLFGWPDSAKALMPTIRCVYKRKHRRASVTHLSGLLLRGYGSHGLAYQTMTLGVWVHDSVMFHTVSYCPVENHFGKGVVLMGANPSTLHRSPPNIIHAMDARMWNEQASLSAKTSSQPTK